MFANELDLRQLEVDQILNQYKPIEDDPKVIFESMDYSLSAGGKRIRPILLLEGCRLNHGDINVCKPLAAAIEMIHTYSLIHDDLPCMDDDILRRGKPTNHIKFSYPIAVLAGDGLLNYAYETMINGFFEIESSMRERYVSAMQIIANAAGVYGMIGGQVADITSDNTIMDEDLLEFIHKNKTGAIITSSLLAGGIIAGADEEKLSALKHYGENIGLMFQIVDDLIDVLGVSTEAGKSVQTDQSLLKITYPQIYGIPKCFQIIDELHQKSADALSIYGEDAEFLLELNTYLKLRMK